MASSDQQPPRDEWGNRYWPHTSFAQTLFDWGAMNDLDVRDDFEFLRSRRVQADYFPDPITEEQAEGALHIAENLVDRLIPGDR